MNLYRGYIGIMEKKMETTILLKSLVRYVLLLGGLGGLSK